MSPEVGRCFLGIPLELHRLNLGALALLNKRLQLTAAGGGVRGGRPSGGRSGVRLASARRSVVRWGTRGRSWAAIR